MIRKFNSAIGFIIIRIRFSFVNPIQLRETIKHIHMDLLSRETKDQIKQDFKDLLLKLVLRYQNNIKRTIHISRNYSKGQTCKSKRQFGRKES